MIKLICQDNFLAAVESAKESSRNFFPWHDDDGDNSDDDDDDNDDGKSDDNVDNSNDDES